LSWTGWPQQIRLPEQIRAFGVRETPRRGTVDQIH